MFRLAKTGRFARSNSIGNNPHRYYLISRFTLTIFKVIGLAPFAMEKSPERSSSIENDCIFVFSRIGVAYNALLILVQPYLGYRSTISIRSEIVYPGQSEFTETIELTLTIFGNFTVVVMWLLYCLRQQNFIKIANRLSNIDANLVRVRCTSGGVNESESVFRNLTILFTYNVIVTIQGLFVEKLAFHGPIISLFSFIVPSLIVNWFIFQYVMALKIIENRYKWLNNSLLDASVNNFVFPICSFLNGRVKLDDLKAEKIVKLRTAHTDLYEISCDLANVFSLPILLAISFIYFNVLYNGFYVVVPFFETTKQTNWMIANSIFWLVVLIFPIGMLASGVNGVTKEMKRTADVIPDSLVRPATSPHEDRIEIDKFSFELLNKDVEFTAFGLFPLDGSLVQSVFGMLGTYLMFMIQVQVASFKFGRTNDTDLTNKIV